jgi:predicted Rossmann fold flavoprotein
MAVHFTGGRKLEKYDLIVIGAGASGLMAAGKAAENGLNVLLLEKMKRPAMKLAITGKGRCNVTNSAPVNEFIKKIKPDGRFLRQAFNKFFNRDVVDFFENRDVKIKLERGGRYFPESDSAHDIVNALVSYCKDNGVNIKTGAPVSEILTENEKVKGVVFNKHYAYSDNILLAVGGDCYHGTGTTGDGYKIAEKLGHKVHDIFGSLVPVELENEFQQQLEGMHLKNVTLSLWNERKKLDEEFGELEFNKTGITGPIVLKLSRKISEFLLKGETLYIQIDLKPALDEQKLDKRLQRELELSANNKLSEMMRKLMLSQLIDTACEINSLNKDSLCRNFGSGERKKLRVWLKNFRLKVKGVRPMNEAIVTAGGVSLKEVNPNTMESKLIEGLYFSGEILNIDADTGGYNLQAAFSTGMSAANAVIEKVRS